MIDKKVEINEIKRILAYEEKLIKNNPQSVENPVGIDLKTVNKMDESKYLKVLQSAFEGSFRQYLMNPVDSKERLKGIVFDYLDIHSFSQIKRLPLRQLERTAKKNLFKREVFTFFEGAVFGLGGIGSAAAEIPLLMRQMYNQVEQIAITFGMDPFQYVERVYIVKVIMLSMCNSQKEKRELVNELHAIEILIKSGKTTKIYEQSSYHYDWLASQASIGTSKAILSAKLIQSIPVLGMGMGAVSNLTLMSRISQVALNCYKRRFLERKWHYNKL
ncbi:MULTISPECIES: EcsC family protein [unclassified Fusibacter]|uniref:EcsC family protein n=1 Tax=unclassified Fusibacter TaxID=2624464 RepID=UPI0013E8FB6D|nr:MULTISPECIES: EcsC family protein [unclassified Fusibacter]MCK8060867.1 EcsC family protein [Fusibacter sp. A2]NPE23163.1 EcsC family protein [Fusibacter sp. A1]